MEADMKRALWCTVTLLLLFPANALLPTGERTRRSQSFDTDWRFNCGDVPHAEQPQFNDNAWRRLNVPHDWSIEGPFSETNKTGGAGGFLPSGVGWYRKHLTLPKGSAGKVVRVEFDGVMQNSDVWINGFQLGHRPYGYVSFSYDLTSHLNFDGDNVLAVRADTSEQPASRWYSGAGIYRHVRLVATGQIHVEPWGAFVSTPQIGPDEATIRVETVVENGLAAAKEVSLQIVLLDLEGKVVGRAGSKPQMVGAGSSARFAQDLAVRNPQLWDLAHPALYRPRV